MNDLREKVIEGIDDFLQELDTNDSEANFQQIERKEYFDNFERIRSSFIESILSLIKEGQINRLKSLNVCRQLAIDEGDGDVVYGDIIDDLISELQDNG